MNILLYCPDNGVTKNFMPHLWMFLLQSLTPPEHKVFLVDGNAQPMTEAELGDYVRANKIELAGIGAMTRMAARAYRMADAIRAAGAKVVMGGPHVTEVPDEPLGRNGRPRHADAIALGEADHTWPQIIEDAARGTLREVYSPALDDSGKDVKPTLMDYPSIPWESINLNQFDLISHMPKWVQMLGKKAGVPWTSLYVVPMESGRGCPYGCDFCTVTGFFGDSIRFRTNESVVDEILRLKARAKLENGKIGVFFIDDNFAINVKRAKSLLREMIARDAKIPWVGQISINLLRDEELLDLIAESGGRWIFIGLESIDKANLEAVHKGFNKPAEYAGILQKLADRGLYAITSFIFGMDGDTPGVAARTLETMDAWPPGLPVFGLMTPYPATPLYDRLLGEGRLTRPEHWLDFKPFRMAYTPTAISIDQSEKEVREAWVRSYSATAIASALEKIKHRPFGERAVLFATRIAFRGIYFPQLSKRQWLGVVWENRRTFYNLVREGIALHRRHKKGELQPPGPAAARPKPETVVSPTTAAPEVPSLTAQDR
jgi:radical SAM superfamily enzyme YgiQ (UPF0313 family)